MFIFFSIIASKIFSQIAGAPPEVKKKKIKKIFI